MIARRARRVVAALAATMPGREIAMRALIRWARREVHSDPETVLARTRRLGTFLHGRGFNRDAGYVYHRVLTLMEGLPEQSVLRVVFTLHRLDLGMPDELAPDVVRRLADRADAAWAARDDATVVDTLDLILSALFHPRIQLGDDASEFSQDPARVLGPLRESRVWTELLRPAPTPSEPPATPHAATPTPVTPSTAPTPVTPSTSPTPVTLRAVAGSRAEPRGSRDTAHNPPHRTAKGNTARPTRILFVSLKNWNFLESIADDFAADPAVDVRRFDLSDLPTPISQRGLLEAKIRLRRTGERPAAPAELREHLDWADTVFVDWYHRGAAWLSLVAPEARLVVRCHSFEALTSSPVLIEHMDAAVFVSPSIRQIVEAAAGIPADEIHDIPNFSRLAEFRRPKSAASARTLGMVSWARPVKDPIFALDILEELRRTDPTWTLHLVGPSFDDRAPYAVQTMERITRLGHAVRVTGWTDDVPAALQEIGVLLSTSMREGTHQALIEGAASGALPVCRNWPAMARWGGPDLLYPSEWVVETPAEAAARIRAHADDDDARTAAQRWVSEHYDWAHVRARYAALLG